MIQASCSGLGRRNSDVAWPELASVRTIFEKLPPHRSALNVSSSTRTLPGGGGGASAGISASLSVKVTRLQSLRPSPRSMSSEAFGSSTMEVTRSAETPNKVHARASSWQHMLCSMPSPPGPRRKASSGSPGTNSLQCMRVTRGSGAPSPTARSAARASRVYAATFLL